MELWWNEMLTRENDQLPTKGQKTILYVISILSFVHSSLDSKKEKKEEKEKAWRIREMGLD